MTSTSVSHATPVRPTARSAAGRLRLVLAANASTSGSAGLLGLVATDWCVDELGLGSVGWTRVVSAGLVAFAVGVLAVSRRRDRLRTGALAISVADGIWVALTAAAVLVVDLTTLGVWAAVVQGVVVADFAAMQALLARRV